MATLAGRDPGLCDAVEGNALAKGQQRLGRGGRPAGSGRRYRGIAKIGVALENPGRVLWRVERQDQRAGRPRRCLCVPVGTRVGAGFRHRAGLPGKVFGKFSERLRIIAACGWLHEAAFTPALREGL